LRDYRIQIVAVAGLAGAGKELTTELIKQAMVGLVECREMSAHFMPEILNWWNNMEPIQKKEYMSHYQLGQAYLYTQYAYNFKGGSPQAVAQKAGFRPVITAYFNEELRQKVGKYYPIMKVLNSIDPKAQLQVICGVRMLEEFDYLLRLRTDIDAAVLYVDAEERLGMQGQLANERSLPAIIQELEREYPERVFRVRNNFASEEQYRNEFPTQFDVAFGQVRQLLGV
jgi:hypothetical protein